MSVLILGLSFLTFGCAEQPGKKKPEKTEKSEKKDAKAGDEKADKKE
ncbi:MAG: hypothetical protein R3A51_07750 [Nannocystaceae bacterium]|nr:hypothetical protein [Myxococcales bacterium]